LTRSRPSGGGELAVIPPLSLYVHIPWCLRKCPYCDFNSHALRERLPEAAYVERLIRDLEQETTALASPRPLTSVFVGGGTPSLLSGEAVARLLHGVRDLTELGPDAEISLEVNPGTADVERFAAYREAGINRLSIGAQSLAETHLERIGRIHGPQDVHLAVEQARSAGFSNLNLDFMYGLPEQSLDEAYQDLREALALQPEHLSYYQLTLEPNTVFHGAPPPLPDEDLIADIQLQAVEMMASKGFVQYEVSAYAQEGFRCRHNLNYWEFGDYLGIGAGAHGKLTDPARNRVDRRWKRCDPVAYLDPANGSQLLAGVQTLCDGDLILEFALNALRLLEGFDPTLFECRTALPFARIASMVDKARSDGLLTRQVDRVRPSELGQRFLDELLQYFIED